MITTTAIKQQYSPLTATTKFPFDIPYFDDEDISVLVVDSEGTSSTLTLGAVDNGFTVDAVNDDSTYGATVTTTESYGSGYAITIYRVVPLTQEVEMVQGGTVKPRVFNIALDRSVAISQQIQDTIGRTITAPVSDPDGVNYDLPSLDIRLGKGLSFDLEGNLTTHELATADTVVILSADVDALSNDVSDLSADVLSLSGDISVFPDQISTLSEDLATLSGEHLALEAEFDAIGQTHVVSELPALTVPEDIYMLTALDGNSPVGLYNNDGTGWKCISQHETIDLLWDTPNVTTVLTAGVTYNVTIDTAITYLDVSLNTTGDTVLILSNPSFYGVADPVTANTYKRSDTGLDSIGTADVEVIISKSGVKTTWSAVTLAVV